MSAKAERKRLTREERKRNVTLDPVKVAIRAIEERDREADKKHEREVVSVLRAQRRPQIERLRDAGSIDSMQHTAAQRLQSDYESSGFAQRLTSNYGEGGFGGGLAGVGMGPTAREYVKAIKAVGIILSPVLCAVVLEDLSAWAWAERSGKRANAGLILLDAALDALAIHYGLKSEKA